MIYALFLLLAIVIYFVATFRFKKDVKKIVAKSNPVETKKEVTYYNINPLLPTESNVKSNVNKFF